MDDKRDTCDEHLNNLDSSKIFTEGVGFLKSKRLDFNSRMSCQKNILNKEKKESHNNIYNDFEKRKESRKNFIEENKISPNSINQAAQDYISSPIILDFSPKSKLSPLKKGIDLSEAKLYINHSIKKATNISNYNELYDKKNFRFFSEKKNKETISTDKNNNSKSGSDSPGLNVCNIIHNSIDKNKNKSYNDINKLKQQAEYFFNQNIFDEYKKITKLISKDSSSNSKLIQSMLKYKIEGLGEK